MQTYRDMKFERQEKFSGSALVWRTRLEQNRNGQSAALPVTNLLFGRIVSSSCALPCAELIEGARQTSYKICLRACREAWDNSGRFANRLGW